MKLIDIPTMKAMITHAGVKRRRPLAFWGPSGIGKSEGIAQAVVEHEGVLVDIRLSQYESVDLRGMPDINAGKTVWNLPATIPFKGNDKFDEDGPLIFLFLDEINSAEPSTAAVAYQLVNDRRVGEHILMDNVVILAAGNRAKDRGVTNRFPSPLANRFTHAELAPSIKAWSGWASKNGINPILIGFLNFREELLHTFDPANPVEAFATPRTWSFVNEDFSDPDIPADVKQALMAGDVGEGPATELMGFVDLMDALKPIEEILANPATVEFERRIDVQWALATHVSGHMTEENADAAQTFLERLEPEMCVLAWTLAIGRDENVTNSQAFLTRYAPRYRAIFQ